MWPWFLECLKRPVCKEEKVHCCVVWVAHSPGQGAAVTLALNSGSSLSDVDECVGDLKRLFFSLFLLPAVWKKKPPMASADRLQTHQVQGPWDSQRDSHLSQVHKNATKIRATPQMTWLQDTQWGNISFCRHPCRCLLPFLHIYFIVLKKMMLNFLSSGFTHSK